LPAVKSEILVDTDSNMHGAKTVSLVETKNTTGRPMETECLGVLNLVLHVQHHTRYMVSGCDAIANKAVTVECFVCLDKIKHDQELIRKSQTAHPTIS